MEWNSKEVFSYGKGYFNNGCKDTIWWTIVINRRIPEIYNAIAQITSPYPPIGANWFTISTSKRWKMVKKNRVPPLPLFDQCSKVNILFFWDPSLSLTRDKRKLRELNSPAKLWDRECREGDHKARSGCLCCSRRRFYTTAAGKQFKSWLWGFSLDITSLHLRFVILNLTHNKSLSHRSEYKKHTLLDIR